MHPLIDGTPFPTSKTGTKLSSGQCSSPEDSSTCPHLRFRQAPEVPCSRASISFLVQQGNLPLTLLQLEHKSKRNHFLREKTSRFTTVPDFTSVGVVFKGDIARQGGEHQLPAASLLIQALGHPQLPQPGCPSMDGSRYLGSRYLGAPRAAQPGRVSPRVPAGRRGWCGLCALRAVRGCRVGEASPNSNRGHPGSSCALHQLGGLDILWGVFLFGCFLLF